MGTDVISRSTREDNEYSTPSNESPAVDNADYSTYSGAILGIEFIYRLCTNLCTGTLNGTAVTKMFGKCCGMAACLLPGVAHLALLYGAAEQQRTGRTKVSPAAAWRAYKTHGQMQANRKNPTSDGAIELTEPANQGNGILV